MKKLIIILAAAFFDRIVTLGVRSVYGEIFQTAEGI